MLRHREKVLAHAERQLASKKKFDQGELLALYKRFLKIEGHRLLLKHYAGGGGREVAAQRAEMMDIVLRHLFDAACRTQGVSQPELALIANGGYGRGELNPLSDVDIMFLHAESRKGVDPKLNEVIQQILYMLWDVGFKVGHSTRSTYTAIQQANVDMLSKTALLEARFVAGNKALFEHFKIEFEKKCVCGFEKGYIQDRVINQSERHEKYGTTIYLQEPNIKNGCGGLRDYQNLLWIAYFRERISSSAGLVEKKLLTETERRKLDKAYDFLLRVRTELHYLNKRATDVLGISFQPQIANKFSYPQKNVLRRTEAFMRDYYQYARDIYRITEQASERLSVFVESEPKKHRLLVFFKPRKKKEAKKEVHFDGFYSVGDLLFIESREAFSQDHFRLIRLFQHAQQRHLKLSSELQRQVQHRLRYVDRTFQYARAGRETFAAILSRKGEVGRILRMMHQVDFLGRYIPEFEGLTCLVQHEFFHRYTADEHTLVCIEKLDELVDTEDPKLAPYRSLFLKLEDPFVLYLALLLHDTGKAANVRYHAEASAMFAQRVAARHQLSSERRKQLIFLVDNHLLISSTAQRRNLEDIATIAEFASLVRDQANLDALMILTLVDGQAVGSEESWSDWKESLVWHLYRSTTAYLEDSEAFIRERQTKREELRSAVTRKLARDFSGEIDAHFSYMPEIYFQTNSSARIISHLRLFRSFLETCLQGQNVLAPAFKWDALPDKGHSEVAVITWDRKQLFAKIAGSFAVEGVNILSADIYTRGDDLVLDLFRVCDTRYQAVTDTKVMERVENNLRQALSSEDFDFLPLLQKVKRKELYQLSQELDFPTRITIDNDTHPVYTIVDIQTPDRLGLLYRLLRGFAELDIDIALSRIATEKGAAIDSFYVTDSMGMKFKGADRIRALQKALQDATSEIPTPKAPSSSQS